MTRSPSRNTTRDRLRSSILLAVLLHALAFVALELFLKLAPQRPPEYTGPLFVQLEQLPFVQQARQPAPVAAAEAAPPRQAAAPAAPPAAVSRAPAEAPPLPAGPALRPAVEAAKTPSSQGSPFRTEGSPAQEGRPRPAGQGFQTSSEEPTLPPAGEPAQGPRADALSPLKAVAPASGSATSTVPLEAVDRALAGGQAAPAAGAASSGAIAQSGQSDLAQEGISIQWEDATRGREPSYTPRPVIPKWVSDAGLRLTVGIAFVLTPQGVLHSVQVEKSSGYSDVDSAVLDAVRRWKFRPGGKKEVIVNGRVSYLILPR